MRRSLSDKCTHFSDKSNWDKWLIYCHRAENFANLFGDSVRVRGLIPPPLKHLAVSWLKILDWQLALEYLRWHT